MLPAFRSVVVTASALLIALFLFLNGCGKQEYVSDEDFIHSLSGTAGGEDGTMPPIGESMEKVAHIRVETNELDVGVIANDGPHQTKLKIYNDGGMPLKLTRVDTTCACTQGFISAENAVVPPGGEAWIDIVIDPFRIPGFESRKVLTITSTDPNKAMVEVGVTAHVDPEYFLETDEIEVGELPKGASVTKRIRFRQLQEKPITIGTIEPLTSLPTSPKSASVAGVAGELAPVPEAEWKTPGKPEFDIVLTVGPDLPAGPFERFVMVHLDIERFRQHRLRVRGTVMAPYRITPVYPQRATLSAEDGSGRVVAHASVKADAPVTLSDFAVENPDLTVAVQPSAFPNEAGLDIVLREGVALTGIDEVVRLKVGLGGQVYDEIIGVRGGLPVTEEGEHHEGDGHNH